MMLLFYLLHCSFLTLMKGTSREGTIVLSRPKDAILNHRIITLKTLTTLPTEPVLSGYNFLVTLIIKKSLYTFITQYTKRSYTIVTLFQM